MKILLIDDDIDLTKILKKSLESVTFVVDTVHDGEKGSFIARTNNYDLIILDNMLPRKNGLNVCLEIRNSGKNTPILMLSSLSEIPQKVELFNAGVDDYITKPYSFEELLARIYSITRRRNESYSSILSTGKIQLNTSTQEVKNGNQLLNLTKKEFALLELLMKNTGKVVSRGLIIEYVWEMDYDPFSRTVDTHILNLRKKIQTKNQQDLIQCVPGRGYKIIQKPAKV